MGHVYASKNSPTAVNSKSTPPVDDKPCEAAPAGNEDAEGVAARIKKAREDRGFTQQVVANRSKWSDPEKKGISRTTLVAYEQGSTLPGLREIRLLCQVLRVTPNWLIYGDESASPTLASRELLGPQLSEFDSVIRTSLALSALKGHERDALDALVLSLAGRQLGDLRLSGLLTLGSVLGQTILKEVAKDESPDLSLQELVERLSEGFRTNAGNRLILDEEGQVQSGTETYLDPKGHQKW